jgi:hypothetical protein
MTSKTTLHAEQPATITTNQWSPGLRVHRAHNNSRNPDEPHHKRHAAHGTLDLIAILEPMVKPEPGSTLLDVIALDIILKDFLRKDLRQVGTRLFLTPPEPRHPIPQDRLEDKPETSAIPMLLPEFRKESR